MINFISDPAISDNTTAELQSEFMWKNISACSRSAQSANPRYGYQKRWKEYRDTFTSDKIEVFTYVDRDTSIEVIEVRDPFQTLPPQRSDLKARKKIRELSRHKDGWKGESSVAAPKEVIRDAEILADTLFSSEEIVMPSIGLDPDGDITFFWKTNKVGIDLSIYGDGTYSYFAEAASGQCFRNGEVSVLESFPIELLQLLRK